MSGRREAICSLCGARLRSNDAVCPICGGQAIPRYSAKVLHVLLEIFVLALVAAGALWYFQPIVGSVAAPTATATRMPWPTATYTDTPTPTITPTRTPTVTSTPFCVPHKVQDSEDIEIVAEIFSVSPEAILRQNRLAEKEDLKPGQVLCIPVDPERVLSLTPDPTATPTPLSYTVRAGDKLADIAARFHSTVDLIVAANALTGTVVLPAGKVLIIPRFYPTATPTVPTSTATPTPTWLSPTLTPTATETPRAYLYLAPVLLSPLSETFFEGERASIVLSWAAVDLLAPTDWYLLRLFREAEERNQLVATVRTKKTSWRVPSSLYPRGQAGLTSFVWEVTVVREKEPGEQVAISPPSSTGRFFWR